MSDVASNLRLTSYMFAAASFDKGENVFNSFIPLIEALLCQLGQDKPISFEQLLDKVNDTYKINASKATLMSMLDIMSKEGKISRGNDKKIVICGQNLNSELLTERAVNEQELTDLFSDFKIFLSEYNIEITPEKAKEIICNFIYDHCHELEVFLRGSRDQQHDNNEEEHSGKLFDFIIKCKRTNEKNYNSILKLYKGAVQTSLLNFSPQKIEEIQTETLPFNNVILDSNFIMRILDIQTEIECKIALETYNSLKSLGAKFFILPETIIEITTAISNFNTDISPYTSQMSDYYRHTRIKTSGLFSAMLRGKTRTEFLELANSKRLQNKLETEFNAEIITDYEHPQYSDEDINSILELKNRNPLSIYGRKQAEHDMTIVSYCRMQRGTDILDFLSSEWWVLTNDNKLTYWNQRNNGNIQECITEAQLSNLLWLNRKKNDNEGLVNTMVTIASRDLLDGQELKRFCEKMDYYKECNKDNPKAIDRLSIVYASGKLTEKYIRSIANEDVEVDHVINEIIDNIQNEQETQKLQKIELEKSYNDTVEENITVKSELSNANKEKDILSDRVEMLELEKEHSRIELELNKSCTKIDLLTREIDDIGKVVDYIPKAGRNLLIKVGFLAVAVCTLLLAAFYYIPQLFKALDINISFKISDTYLGILVSVICSFLVPVCTLAVAAITAYKSGNPMTFSEIFIAATSKNIQKYARKSNIKLDIEPSKKELIEIKKMKINEIIDIQKTEISLKKQLENINSAIEQKLSISK